MQSLSEMGGQGRAALAWTWALDGTRPSPVTLAVASGRPPSREEIAAESSARPEGSTAPPGVPTDRCDQLGEVRSILRWLIGEADEIPVDDDNRGRLVGARDDYARTDQEIREVRARAACGLESCDLPEHMDSAEVRNPWHWDPAWMNASWLRGVRDLLHWVLGERSTSPLGHRVIGMPAPLDVDCEDVATDNVILQGRPGGPLVDPEAYPPPQYGEAVQATIRWLRGGITTPPVDHRGRGPYIPSGNGALDW